MGSTCCRGDPTSTESEIEAIPSLPETKIFDITLTRRGSAKIGLDVDHHPNAKESMAICIETVQEGLVSELNAKQPSMAFKEGDLITNCNGKAGNSQDMMSSIGNSNSTASIWSDASVSTCASAAGEALQLDSPRTGCHRVNCNPVSRVAPEVTVQSQFTGRWKLNLKRSDDPSEMLKAMGVPWAARAAVARYARVVEIQQEGLRWTETMITPVVKKTVVMTLDGTPHVEMSPVDKSTLTMRSRYSEDGKEVVDEYDEDRDLEAGGSDAYDDEEMEGDALEEGERDKNLDTEKFPQRREQLHMLKLVKTSLDDDNVVNSN